MTWILKRLMIKYSTEFLGSEISVFFFEEMDGLFEFY